VSRDSQSPHGGAYTAAMNNSLVHQALPSVSGFGADGCNQSTWSTSSRSSEKDEVHMLASSSRAARFDRVSLVVGQKVVVAVSIT
jgi:hypothetical protein